MKMTSKGTLLLTLTGVIGLGCSAPAEGGDADPPSMNPPYFGQPQTQQPLNPAPNPMGTAGAGGVQVGGVAGSGNVPPPMGAAGAGGAMMGAAGAGGAPAGGTIPRGEPGTGFELVPVAGWVAGTTNEAGIQGSFYTISDTAEMPPGVTTITMDDFATAGDAICVSGVASQVVGTAYSQYWGGGVAFDLGDPGQMQPQQPWTRGNVVGFRYTLTGPTIPPGTSLRFIVTFEGQMGTDPYCQQVTATSGTPVTSMLSSAQLIQACWQAGGAQIPPTARLTSLQWQVSTNTEAPTPFDFCIEDLTAVVQ
jgi:hypothetical protein